MGVEGLFYRVSYKDDEALGVGRAPQRQDLYVSPYEGAIQDWELLVLDLHDGDYPDYLPSDFGGRICSKRLREVFDRYAIPKDRLQWLDVLVRRHGDTRDYYYLHFPQPPSVLNIQETTFAAGTDFVVKPVLDPKLAKDHNVFTYPKNTGGVLFLSEIVKNELETLDMTGMDFTRVPAR